LILSGIPLPFFWRGAQMAKRTEPTQDASSLHDYAHWELCKRAVAANETLCTIARHAGTDALLPYRRLMATELLALSAASAELAGQFARAAGAEDAALTAKVERLRAAADDQALPADTRVAFRGAYCALEGATYVDCDTGTRRFHLARLRLEILQRLFRFLDVPAIMALSRTAKCFALMWRSGHVTSVGSDARIDVSRRPGAWLSAHPILNGAVAGIGEQNQRLRRLRVVLRETKKKKKKKNNDNEKKKKKKPSDDAKAPFFAPRQDADLPLGCCTDLITIVSCLPRYAPFLETLQLVVHNGPCRTTVEQIDATIQLSASVRSLSLTSWFCAIRAPGVVHLSLDPLDSLQKEFMARLLQHKRAPRLADLMPALEHVRLGKLLVYDKHCYGMLPETLKTVTFFSVAQAVSWMPHLRGGELFYVKTNYIVEEEQDPPHRKRIGMVNNTQLVVELLMHAARVCGRWTSSLFIDAELVDNIYVSDAIHSSRDITAAFISGHIRLYVDAEFAKDRMVFTPQFEPLPISLLFIDPDVSCLPWASAARISLAKIRRSDAGPEISSYSPEVLSAGF
jgi:hypothetical protein